MDIIKKENTEWLHGGGKYDISGNERAKKRIGLFV